MATLSILLTLSVWISGVRGHGRLLEPPGRASMWRFGYNSPPNYDDNQLFCGGFNRQWKINGGKCGVCGDPWDGRREHEAGGKYATGTIVRHYSEGQTITVNVQITASHKGYFEFRLCPHNNPSTRVSQACLDQHVLQQTDGSTRVYEAGHPTTNTVHLKLPTGVTCSQCLLQWKYNAGNSYGCDGTNCCIGCGEQEQFYGCSDVSIGSVDAPSYSSEQISSSVNHPVNISPQGQTQTAGIHFQPLSSVQHQGQFIQTPQSSGYIPQNINPVSVGSVGASGQLHSSVYQSAQVKPQESAHTSGSILSSVFHPINVIPQGQTQTSGIHFLLPSSAQHQGQSIQNHKPAGYVPQNAFPFISGHLFSGVTGSQPCKATPRYRAVYQYADKYCAVQCSRGNCPGLQYCTSACRRSTGGK
ncbi:hypothetical protein KP79_PYT16194 [Mizuhopecten yessoensis]|uniref:Chitin-binding type-4 domain-containing protein n=1 Tax=Mizuhopecten yessoensis TaxID=6573 RepID=A0A210QIR3_MIZYE|nr:hypothetical protein KP79_PYT16194 [Mizuhopecten yessoensis]